MRNIMTFGLLAGLVLTAGCSSNDSWDRWVSASSKRGNTYDYDPGPSKDGEINKLFADTPNYRAFGSKVIGGRGEKFRWKFGPMWYRGRLGKNQVKVFIIGQEGAQDENVSNRSFTGSTGTKMQKFLNHMGINSSYLFMNTFVYTITGQYSLFGEDRENAKKVDQRERLIWLAQNKDSIVVEHRHKLFDTVLENNDELSVIIGVGTAGKDSAATYANHLNGDKKCSNSKVGRGGCYVNYQGKNILVMGVPHPGGASPRNGGEAALQRLLGSFDRQAKVVLKAVESGKISLPKDTGARRAKSTTRYRYGNASVPHKDFAFGTNWRMGEWGTTSNRRGSHTIQVFSKDGCYNNTKKDPATGRCSQTTDRIKYDDPVDKMTSKPKQMAKCDVPYESSKGCTSAYKVFDHGPGQKYAKLLIEFFEDVDWPSLGVTQHMSFGPQGMYRGTPENASYLVIADQFAHDDMFSGRAFTGEVGQRFQGVLNKSRRKYVILRTAPVDTLDLSDSAREKVLFDSDVVKARNKVIDAIMKDNKITKVIGVGSYASKIAKDVASSYGVSNKNYTESAVRKLSLNIIPRKDLPSHTRWWMGTSGDRAARAYRGSGSSKVYDGNYYKVYAPRWATKWRKGSTSSAENRSYAKFEKWYSEKE